MSTENILATYAKVSPQDIVTGSTWYWRAREECRNLAEKHNLPLETVVGVVAAISPRMRWDVNIEQADRIISGKKSWAFKSNDDKARRIVQTGDTSILSGPKVTSFYQNILEPDHPDVVVVDTWAWRIWADKRTTKTIDKRLYWRVAADYREAARIAGITPSRLQAITWEYARRTFAI